MKLKIVDLNKEVECNESDNLFVVLKTIDPTLTKKVIAYQEDKQLFDKVRNINDFYTQVSALYGDRLNDKSDTIIFLDEIQVYPHLLSMLKPLKHDNKYKYIASGSLLGVTLKHAFIPMGSIDEERMYPMDFEEFL